MNEILDAIIKFIFTIPDYIKVYIYSGIIAFIIGLAFVYLIGRMLNLVKEDRIKNLTAFIIIVISNFVFVFLYRYIDNLNSAINIIRYICDSILSGSISILLYVLIGFKLYPTIQKKINKKDK